MTKSNDYRILLVLTGLLVVALMTPFLDMQFNSHMWVATQTQ